MDNSRSVRGGSIEGAVAPCSENVRQQVLQCQGQFALADLGELWVCPAKADVDPLGSGHSDWYMEVPKPVCHQVQHSIARRVARVIGLGYFADLLNRLRTNLRRDHRDDRAEQGDTPGLWKCSDLRKTWIDRHGCSFDPPVVTDRVLSATPNQMGR